MVTRIALAVVVLLVVLQFVPVAKTNPTVTRQVHWDSPATRLLAQRACFDCHSNVTSWPWYVRLAPASFLISHDVSEGREDLNFSEWDKPQRARIDEVAEEVNDGDMPPWYYVPLHPGAKLSSEEQQQLITGLRATFAKDPPVPAPRRRPSRD